MKLALKGERENNCPSSVQKEDFIERAQPCNSVLYVKKEFYN